jgi:hypothetical protein
MDVIWKRGLKSPDRLASRVGKESQQAVDAAWDVPGKGPDQSARYGAETEGVAETGRQVQRRSTPSGEPSALATGIETAFLTTDGAGESPGPPIDIVEAWLYGRT